MRAWERQLGESDKAWEGFKLYRDLGPARSLRAVAEALYGVRWKHGKRTVEGWSSRNDWVDRVQALEARDEMIRREAVEEHFRRQADDHGRREAALRERALSVREEAMEQAEKMVGWPLTRQRVVNDSEDGETVVYEFHPAGWSKATAVSLYNLAVGNAPVEPQEPEVEFDFSQLSDSEIYEYMRLSERLGIKPARPEQE